MSTTAEVKLWGTTIGAVNLRDGETIADFEYDPEGNWTGSHQMRLNGKTDNFVLDDFISCGKFAGLKRGLAEQLVEDVALNVNQWEKFAYEAGVDEKRTLAIKNQLPRL